MNRTLLVAPAHPDDESFPMGGTLAKYAAEETRVTLVSDTRGEAGNPRPERRRNRPYPRGRIARRRLLNGADDPDAARALEAQGKILLFVLLDGKPGGFWRQIPYAPKCPKH